MNEKQFHKLPSLDGWRAVSIALVLAQHSIYAAGFPARWIPWFKRLDLGALGVQFFFVISGFLITWLLLSEQARHGGISLKHFYLRRALRILPVYFFYLLVVEFLTHFEQPGYLWAANLTFTTNFFWPSGATAHLWSLGVEEQFYLLWPGLLVWILRGEKPEGKRLLKFLLVPLLLIPLMRVAECKHWYPHQPEVWHHLFATGSFFMRSDSLAYGCALAVGLHYWRPAISDFYEKHQRWTSWVGAGLIGLVIGLRWLHPPARLMAAASEPLLSLGLGLLLLQSVLQPTRGFFRGLNWKWVQHLGVLSYSIYIWQQLFCGTGEEVFGVPGAWWTNFPVWILSALLAAHASYYLLEKPLLSLRARFR